MRSINHSQSIHFQKVFNQKAWADLCHKNATLQDVDLHSLSLPRGTIHNKADAQSYLKDRTITQESNASWFSKKNDHKKKDAGRHMFSAYIEYISHDDHSADEKKSPAGNVTVDMNNSQHFRVACAFVASGVCRFNKNLELIFTDRVIDKTLVEEIDSLLNHSVVRLAYSFLALNIKLPKGFLEKVFIPYFVTEMVINNVSLSENDARTLLNEILASDGVKIIREADITLEHVMELKNRLLNNGYLQPAADQSLSSTESQESQESQESLPDHRPRLPKPVSNYRCDHDDTWLITYQVEHHRSLQILSNFAQRIKLWAQRNKRVIALEAVEVVSISIIAGVTTGGIGAAIYLASQIVYDVFQMSIGVLLTKIKTKLHRRKIGMVEAKIASPLSGDFSSNKTLDSRDVKDISDLNDPSDQKKHQNIHRLLDGTAYLSKEHDLTKITNLIIGMKKLSDKLIEQQKTAGDSLKNRLRFQRLQVVARRYAAEYDLAAQNYDKMLVAGIQKTSELDHRFESLFTKMWAPLKSMPDDQLASVLNESVNHSSVKGRWYLSKVDGLGWIQSVVSKSPSNLSSRIIEQRIGQVILSRDKEKLTEKLAMASNKARRKIAIVSVCCKKIGLTYLWERIKPARMASTVVAVLGKHLSKGTKPGLDLIIPNILPFWAGVFAILYTAGQVVNFLNNKGNRKKADNVQSKINNELEDDKALSMSDWFALRREAKQESDGYVTKIKQLIEVLDTMEELAAVELPLDHNSPKYREHLIKVTTCMLSYKKLMHEQEDQLYGSVGLMHHTSMQYKLRFDQQLHCIQVAD
ncbi:MAG: hypothetical protein KAG53_03590 [Endozoicomonadaceae bacterium]|nr:hypothetical protein [Endozoicomonadaceae bacterium]